MIAALLTGLTVLSSWDTATSEIAAINTLIDGLHRAVDRGDFQFSFARYTSTAVFMGTDKIEHWTIHAFNQYSALAFADGHG